MAEIEHIVYLMLENRSLDNVLGWLYQPDDTPCIVSHRPPVDPVPPDRYDGCHEIRGCLSSLVTKGIGRARRAPTFDPHEVYAHVNNQLFGTLATPVRDTSPTMCGFVKDYANWYRRPDQIKATFTPDELPVLNGLARSFAVSDRYFSSVPTQTNTNRAFAATGNSLGMNDAGALQAWVDNRGSGVLQLGRPTGRQFCQPTMWNVLCEAGFDSPEDWMIFNSRGNWLENLVKAEGYQYTRLIMERLQPHSFDPHFGIVGTPGTTDQRTFFGKVAAGTLPTFSFLEPQWGIQQGFGLLPNGTDYHPPSAMHPGEVFLETLYDALTSNPDVWRRVLFIVNFDEHGGTFDHVPPPWSARPPWDGEYGTPEPEFLEGGFAYDRFGVRVPLILISPWVRCNTVFRAGGEIPFDHTSVIATVLTLMGVEADAWRHRLGARTAHAPTFEWVLSDTPRTDVPRVHLADRRVRPRGHR
jgi:phospholipase C